MNKKKVGAVIGSSIAAIAIMGTVPAAAQAATVKRVTPADATVSASTEANKVTLTATRGGVAFRSVYLEDDTGNVYWNRLGAMNGFDGRPVDAYYDFDNDRYVAKVKTALSLVPESARAGVIRSYVEDRVGEDAPWSDYQEMVTAFNTTGLDYLSVDGKNTVASHKEAASPVLADLEVARNAAASSAGTINVAEKSVVRNGRETTSVRFTGAVNANGTKAMTFRLQFNEAGNLMKATIVDGKGRVIARDVLTYNTPDTIVIPNSAYYGSIVP